MSKSKNPEQVEKEFIDRVGKISKQWGIGEPAGRVWAALIFEGKSISQKDIAKRTGYSLSLVSPSIKILEKSNIIRPIRNGRETQYELTGTFTGSFKGMVNNFLEHDIKPIINQLEQVDISDAEKQKHINRLVKEYKGLENYLNVFMKILDMREAALKNLNKLKGD